MKGWDRKNGERTLPSAKFLVDAYTYIQLNFSNMATVSPGTEESGLCRAVVILERFKRSQCMDRPPKKAAVAERWPLGEVL